MAISTISADNIYQLKNIKTAAYLCSGFFCSSRMLRHWGKLRSVANSRCDFVSIVAKKGNNTAKIVSLLSMAKGWHPWLGYFRPCRAPYVIQYQLKPRNKHSINW
jgi:hypothetical protein